MSQRILVDTGVWYAMFAKGDQHASALAQKSEFLDSPYRVIVPWPTVYEALRTQFVKKPLALGRFENYLKKTNVEFLEAECYRDEVFNETFELSLRQNRPMSMVDCLLRRIMSDAELSLDGFITFNANDFRDVCSVRKISML
jgi:predicted nucleic acid-binding protein